MKKLIKFLILLSVFSASLPLFATPAVVTYVSGKVEVNRNNSWIQLKTGDTLNESDMISTGFNSEAKIKYNDSLMSLGALTRITLRELSSSENKQNVDVYLNTGAVRSKVTHTENTRVSYRVTSPVSVASVRGTILEVHSDGEVICIEGGVAVYPNTENKPKKAESKKKVESEVSDDKEVEKSEEPEAADTKETVDTNYGSATSNTPAAEIDYDAPKGAVVIGAGQRTEFSAEGRPETPQVVQKRETQAKTSGVSTAAESDAVNSSTTVVTSGPSDTPSIPTGGFLFDLIIPEP